jgi:bacteriocin biosynthesis cyclodehydratase domain-containing protein
MLLDRPVAGATDLPRRPRIRPGLPVLRRRAGEIQVGLDPRYAAVVSGLPEPVVTAASRLTGERTIDELLAGLGTDPAGRPAMLELLRILTDRGLIQDAAGEAAPIPGRLRGEAAGVRRPAAADPANRHGLVVAVHGDGRLAVSIACLLAAAGVGWVHVAARGSVRPEDTGTGYLSDDVGRARRAAAMSAVRRVDSRVRTSPVGARRPDLAVLADAAVPDPVLVSVLTADAVPHLPAYLRGGVGVVGPLVAPGRTSCLRCADLHRSERDACWPGIAAQLAGVPQLADVAGTQATAAFAAAQALDALAWSHASQARPATWNASVEIDPISARTHHRSWKPHAGCPCRDHWPAAV